MNETDIARQLLACAARAGNSEQKRTHFIDLPRLVLGLARDIATGQGHRQGHRLDWRGAREPGGFQPGQQGRVQVERGKSDVG